MFAFPARGSDQERYPQPLEMPFKFVRNIFWKRWVAAKVSPGNVSSGPLRDQRNFQAGSQERRKQDPPPSLSSTIDATTGRRHRAIERTHLLGCIGDDAGNGHSMLKWKIRARAGRFRQRQSREKMAEAEMPVTCLLKFSEMLCQIPSRPGRKSFLWSVISKRFVFSKTRHSCFFLAGRLGWTLERCSRPQRYAVGTKLVWSVS